MKKGLMSYGLMATIALFTSSCVTFVPASSSHSSGSGSSEASSSSSHSSSSSSSESSSSGSSSASVSEEPTVYHVYFYDEAGEIYYDLTVEEGETVDAPDSPVVEDQKFVGWFTADGEEYDFSSPVYEDLSLYAQFAEFSYFDGYSPKYQPTVSPLTCSDVFIEGQEDVTLHLSAKNVGFADKLVEKMVRLSGAFAGLTVKSIAKDGDNLNVETTGAIGNGKGVVCLAQAATDIGVYLTASFPVVGFDQIIDRTSFGFPEDKKQLDFSVHLPNKATLLNEQQLGKDDYIAKINSGEYPYLSVKNAQGYSLQMLELADDFGSFRLRLTCPKELDASVYEELCDKVRIHVAPEAVSGNIRVDFPVDLLHPIAKSSLKMYRKNGDLYHVYLEMKFHSCKLNDSFKDKADQVLADPLNKNFLVTFDGADSTLTKLDLPDKVTLKAEYDVPSSIGDAAKATITLPKIQFDKDGDAVPIAVAFTDGKAIEGKMETLDCVLDQTLEPGGGTGTVTQNSVQSYNAVKSSVEQSAFHQGRESDYNAGAIVSTATNIGKIGFGLYSGDFTMAKTGAAELFGLEGLKTPSDKILSALASISAKLVEIEAKIDSIASTLQTIQAELEALGKSSLLSNYLAANSRWNDFLTDYYVPLKDAIVSYSNDYFRYFYELTIDSYDPFPGTERFVTLYYDRTGALAFPGRNPALSIDGKAIDKAATRKVQLPTLHYALAGIFAHDGHVYSSIEEDIIADLFSHGEYDEETIADVVSTIRYQAMQSHFSTGADLDAFNLTFANFCAAFTATEIGEGTQASITPLDAYRIMLETVYNFGFEIEPEFNLAAVKIESAYYCARSILEFTRFINSGEIVSSRYDDLDKAVQKELTDGRFYHSNKDANTIYSYSASTYVKFCCDSFGINIVWDWKWGDGLQQLDHYLTRRDTFSLDNYDPLPGLSSIDETAIRFMALKVKLYNSLKGTNLDFKTYLAQIGIIPQSKLQFTLGVILRQDGFLDDDDDVAALRVPKNWYINTDSANTFAFKGWAYSFADGDFVDCLAAICWDWGGAALSDVTMANITNVGELVQDYGNWHKRGVQAYYVNFIPA